MKMKESIIKAEDLDIIMKEFMITKDDLETITEEIENVHPWYIQVSECRPVRRYKQRLKVEAEFIDGRFETFTFKIRPLAGDEQPIFELLD